MRRTVADMSAAESVLLPANDDALADLQANLNLTFARARSLWKEAAARVHPDLQPSGYKLLMFITRVGESNAHQLAECFEMDKSVISRQVRMLEDHGFLESRPDDRDGRQRVLTPTPQACAVVAELRSENVHRLREVLAGLTSTEVQAASKVFRILAET